ncbi:hypothetical protein [Arenimonas sp. MALMAid1274]|uniref:hypothetical protein n=1 Tax=Arenimonas sp. MALMAid1274 TaxID=3411630 RepID=UPI003B9E074D
MRVLLLALGLSISPAMAQSALWDAESRWEFITGGDDIGAYVAYLRDYPDSPHVAEARARLEAFRNEPAARLDTPACAAVLQSRAESMLATAVEGHHASFDARVPADHFLSSSTLLVEPRGQAPGQAPIESRIYLTLTADTAGGCRLMHRWSIGSGLPQECRCSPRDPDYRAPSPVVAAVFSDLLRFKALNAACIARGQPDLSVEIQAFLAESIASREARAAALQARVASGGELSAAEQVEVDQILGALPALKAGDYPVGLADRQAGAVRDMTREQLDTLCAGRLPGIVAGARQAVGGEGPAQP